MAKKEIKTQTIEEILADHVEHLRSIRADPNQETLADNLRKAGVILSRYVVVE